MQEVDLCNQALTLLGHRTISSFSEDSPAGQACRVHFHPLRRKVLRGGLWGCARRREELIQIADFNGGIWSYAYLYPTDCLMIWFLEPQQGKFPAFTTAVHAGERVIMTNVTAPAAHYIYDSEDYSLWDPMLVDAFVFALASYLAVPLTGDTNLAAHFRKLAQSSIIEAQAVAFNELSRTWVDSYIPQALRAFTGQADPLEIDFGAVETGGFGSELG